MKKRISLLALAAGLALGVAQQAMARDISVQGVTVLWSSLLPAPTVSDTINIDNGGILIVNTGTSAAPATAGRITIGDTATPGTLRFDTTSRTLRVAGDVQFGNNPANQLDMTSLIGTAEHVLGVSSNFLAAGVGTFSVGLGTVEYYGASQTITAQIAGTTINYRNLSLQGSGTKTLQNGLTVQGELSIRSGVTLAGSVPVIYGPLSSLRYVGEQIQPQLTTSLEWPSSSSLTVQLTRLSAASPPFLLKLDGDKTMAGSLIVDSLCALDTDGKNLTLRGSVDNSGFVVGAGRVILAGTTAQSIVGAGTFGNVTLNNSAGATAPTTGLKVGGRLVLSSGKLTLSGTASTANLLTLGTADQSLLPPSQPRTYGSTASAADTKTDTYFAGTGTVRLTVKPVATFDVARTNIAYGTASQAITGKVTGGEFGNGAAVGDAVSVTVTTGTTPLVRQTQVSATDGSFTALFDTSTLSAGSYTVTYEYFGGINLAAGTRSLVQPNDPGLVVAPLTITVTPREKSKVYGATDPPLDFDYSPALQSGDNFTGTLTRDGAGQPPTAGGGSPTGEQAGSYEIRKGTLTLPSSYQLTVVAGKFLRINPVQMIVVATATSKTYGTADPASLPYTFTPPTLRYNDSFDGQLDRTDGETAGDYEINQGTLVVKSANGNTGNYAIGFTPAVFRINRRTTTIGLAAGSTGKTYGATNQARLVPTYNPALAFTDVTDPETSLARAPGEDAGSYPINLGNLKIISGSTNMTANYILNIPSSLNYVISKRDLIISANSKQIDYGAEIKDLVKYERRSLTNTTVWEVWDSTTATPATVANWSPSQPVVGSLPRAYTYEVLRTAVDPNYNITYLPVAGTIPGTLTIVKKALTVRADNQSKVQDGLPFPTSAYTSSANFVAGDNFSTAFTGGSQSYSGTAINATAAGVYEITTTGTYTSDKYGTISYAPGSLVISTGIETVNATNIVTWGPGGNYSWTINQANGGQAGVSPGWKLLKVKKNTGGQGGELQITATDTPGGRFKIYLSTLSLATSATGPAAKFDPTRAYTWKIVEAETSITGFAANKFELISDGVGLFANGTFGGTFSVAVAEGDTPKELYLKFTPPPQTGDGSLTDAKVDELLNSVLTSDVDVMYLQADKATNSPQETVTIRLNVGNLRQSVFGAQAFLSFSSQHYVATRTGSGSPVVAPGGGVWDNVIYTLWNTNNGALDTVIGLSFSATLGTMDPATVAFITLTPNRTNTGPSRVIFRADSDVLAGSSVSGGTFVTVGDGTIVRPARVYTKNVTIPADTTKPKINSIVATQSQNGATVNVKDGPSDNPVSVRAVRGTVNITINATDLPGLGLAGAPTLLFKREGSNDEVPVNASTGGSNDGDFRYDWVIPGASNVVSGKWIATVTASDSKVPPQTETTSFFVTVNTREVTGVVELDSFRGTTRNVTFTAGNGAGTNVLKTWSNPVTTTDTTFLPAGEFADLPAFAKELLAPKTAVQTSAYLRYGSVANLASLVNRVLFGTDNFAAYMRDLEFGFFKSDSLVDVTNFHTQVALRLKFPQRSVDSYIRGRLSADTISLLNAYPAAITNVTAEQLAALETALLNDYNTIVLGPSIYDPLRFASVEPPVRNNPEIDAILDRMEDTNPDNNPSAQEIQYLNRLLLNGAYLPYIYGELNPATAQAMVNYAGGTDPNLTGLILLDLDNLTAVANKPLWQEDGDPEEKSLYTELRFLGIPLRKATSDEVVELLKGTAFDDARTIQLNRWLLEDAFAQSVGALNYSAGALSAGTAIKLQTFVAAANSANKAALEPSLVTDLNKVLTSGVLTRANFETAYPTEITKYMTRGVYLLVDVPSEMTMIGAKTSWNLRERLTPVVGDPAKDPTRFVAHFVNGEKVDSNNYLRGGDINADNIVNLSDFTILQQVYLTANQVADINGDGGVNVRDYSILQINFGATGDPAVNQP